MASYERALIERPGDPSGIADGLARFKSTYADLASPELADRVAETYAESLFFNDTLHSFHDRDALQAYMAKVSSQLEHSQVDVHQVLIDGDDVFLRWTMRFAGRSIQSNSIGMSHLRFNSEGQVILHQDFWDSGHGLYAHLPVVGFVLRRVRERL